jgi:LysM repeat protein
MRSLFGNNCAKGCLVYLFALVLIVVVTSMGLSGLSARFGGATVQGNRPDLSALSVDQGGNGTQSAPAAPNTIPDGRGGGLPPTPVGQPPPTIAPVVSTPQATVAPPPPAQGQGGTITGETSPPFYIVQSGDSLWLIAHRFGVDIDALRRINNIVDNLIYPGQILYLPTSGQPAAQSPAPGAPSAGADAGTGAQGQAQGQEPVIPAMPDTGITSRKP